MNDQLGPAAQGRLARRVHVAHDHRRLDALFEQRLGPSIDGDDHRAHVADEGAQRAQVALMANAAHHDERGPVAKVRAKARQLDAPRQQLALLAHVLDGVVREALERV